MVKSSVTAETKDVVMNRGAWTAEEDKKLMDFVHAHGDKRWRTLPAKAGLNRCGKSCRLRWLNYLRPGIKRGNISSEEEDLIIRLHNLIGNRWSLIAGRLPGRTDNEIKNHWNTHLSKKSLTISDLNSKLNHVPQNNSHQSNACHVPPCSVPSSSIQATLMGAENQPWREISHQMSFDMDELFNLPFLQEVSYITSPEPYNSLSKIWLLPSTTMGGESSSSGIAGLPCYKDWFHYPPSMAI